MKTNNIKMLGIYYSAQKILLDNLAAPLGNGLKSVIVSDDYELIAMKALPFLRQGVNKGKLEGLIEKIFTQIDSGAIKPNQYVGHAFSLEETIDQFEIHDGFMALHDSFFNHIESFNKEDIETISEKVLVELVKMKLSAAEMMALKELFMGATIRSPITLEVNDLQEVVDCMYEASCSIYGPTKTDQILSNSVKGASQKILNFNASIFL